MYNFENGIFLKTIVVFLRPKYISLRWTRVVVKVRSNILSRMINCSRIFFFAKRVMQYIINIYALFLCLYLYLVICNILFDMLSHEYYVVQSFNQGRHLSFNMLYIILMLIYEHSLHRFQFFDILLIFLCPLSSN